MRLTTCLASLVAVALCSGCATSYRPAGRGTEGYSEIRLSQDEFEVTFWGNCYTSAERVQECALLRAAEVAGENGFKCFAVIREERRSRASARMIQESTTDGSKQTMDQRTQSDARRSVSTGYAVSVPRVRHKGFDRQIRFRIQGFHEEPRGIHIFDAAFCRQSIRAKYGIK